MRRQQFQVENREVRRVPEPGRVSTTDLKTARRAELPARTEVIVPYKPTHASTWLHQSAAVAQPCSNQWRYALWIREANLKLKPTKCCLMQAQVPFLRHIVSRQGVGMDPDKTEAIEQWPTPTSVKDIRAFLGLASYYRRYIPSFSPVAASLTNLTRQGVDLVWDNAREGAFRTLKAALVSATILAYPTRERHFVLSPDASDVGIGAVLEQEQEEGGRVAKKVIAVI